MGKKGKCLIKVDDSIYDGLYDAEMNSTKVALKFSKMDGKWTKLFNGKTAVTLHDDGNGVTVRFRGGKTLRLDYCQIVQLRALFNVHDDAYASVSNFGRPKFTKTKIRG